MELSSIGAVSIQSHLAQTQQEAGISIMKKAMDLQETSMNNLLQSLETAAPAVHTGQRLNLLV